MKKLLFTLMTMATIVAFTGCSKDDNNNKKEIIELTPDEKIEALDGTWENNDNNKESIFAFTVESVLSGSIVKGRLFISSPLLWSSNFKDYGHFEFQYSAASDTKTPLIYKASNEKTANYTSLKFVSKTEIVISSLSFKKQ